MARTQKPGVDEEFKPISEWKEEPENSVLFIHLSDFTKEQIKITCVKSSRVVRVHGERKLANNKWRRFNEAFPIPENCKIDEIHAKWSNERLIITMPKETITPNIAAPNKEEKLKTAQDKEAAMVVPPKTAQKPLPSKQGPAATTSSTISEKQIDKSSSTISSPKDTSSIHGEKHTDGKRVADALNAHKKDEKDTKHQKGAEESSQKLTPTSKTGTKQTDLDGNKTVVPDQRGNLVEHKGKGEAKIKEIPLELKKPENVITDATLLKESIVPKTTAEKGKEKKSMAADALKAVMEQTEERQLMVNMGVAVLVIIAIGAYVSYRFCSKSKSSSS